MNQHTNAHDELVAHTELFGSVWLEDDQPIMDTISNTFETN